MTKKMLYGSVLLNIIFIIGFILIIQALGGWNFLYYKMNNRGLGSEYEHRKTLYEKMEIERGAIVFLGNSITAQCDWTELLSNPKIRNRGIPGETTDGILERVGALLEQKPSKLFLMIGVNDLLFHPPKYIVENYKEIVSKILSESPTTQLYLYSILPVNSKVRIIPIQNTDIQLINQKIEQLANEKGLTFINLYPKFANEDGALFAKYTSDGIHLNGAAYIVWKDEIEQFLD